MNCKTNTMKIKKNVIEFSFPKKEVTSSFLLVKLWNQRNIGLSMHERVDLL